MDTILISTKDLLYDAKYAPHIFISAHSTYRTKSIYNDIKFSRIFNLEPESWRVKIDFSLISHNQKNVN